MAAKRHGSKVSTVWNYFHKDDEEMATCLVGCCRAKIKHSKNTSNLLKHLKCKHIQEHDKCLEERRVDKQNKKSKYATNQGEHSLQPTLTQTIDRSTSYPRESTRRRKIEDALISMIVTDMQPSSIVEDKGFRNFVKTVDSRYELPSRRTIMRSILPDKYQKVKEEVRKELDATVNLALTTDIWTSRQTQSYCCVTVHYITDTWCLKSAVLETFEFNCDHTADNIASKLHTVATSWGIDEKVVCVVTDNASNMVSGISKTGWRHLPCFAHTLNLIVQDSIKKNSELSEIQNKYKEVVSHFHRSVKSSDKLKEVQQQLSLPEQKLIQEVPTRWNSTYLMLERFHQQFEAITTALCLLGQNQLCLAADEKEKIKSVLTYLKPFLDATEDISGETYVSVSMIIPLTKLLQQQYHLTRSSSTLATTLSSELCRRFLSIESAYVTAVTTLLDPRFKKIPFRDQSALENTIRRITQELAAMQIATQDTNDHNSNTTGDLSGSSEDQPSSSSLWAAFDKQVTESSSRRTTTSDAMIELRRYFEESNIERKKNPLNWWKENEIRFPKLQALAKKYLCIPGSSVPSERLFSKAGQLVSERRSRLKPKHIDMMLFLNQNL